MFTARSLFSQNFVYSEAGNRPIPRSMGVQYYISWLYYFHVVNMFWLALSSEALVKTKGGSFFVKGISVEGWMISGKFSSIWSKARMAQVILFYLCLFWCLLFLPHILGCCWWRCRCCVCLKGERKWVKTEKMLWNYYWKNCDGIDIWMQYSWH